MKLILDLHLHSKASFDGRMGIEEIAALAKHGVWMGWPSVTTMWSTPALRRWMGC